ncbi:transglutaminase domain-containing protein [Streptomyces sp. NBC_00503]|uniref:transglutaminase domain-containing protein n=1 Tax=Streptomyces sp. NBC_00503 TaxID=2903659 RepID=UPI002E810FAA|nr:transglutaminase domain-containing protein [Streptomyces sp. NBC_00503]WUD84092.1 transglutaminase domain-containing protein [Streptomyces sp. NBC_00503]
MNRFSTVADGAPAPQAARSRAGGPVAFELLLPAMDRFLPAPAWSARYDTDAHAAADWLCTDPAFLLRLGQEHGLPYLDDPVRGPLFERADLANLALMSGSERTTLERALRFQLGFSAGPASGWLEPREWLVTVGLGEAEGGRYRLRVPDWDAPGVTALDGTGPDTLVRGTEFTDRGYQVAVRITGAADQVRDERARTVHAEMMADLHARRVVYQRVTEPLRIEHQRAWDAGMTDCIVVSRVFTDRLRALGLRARARRGWLLGVVGSEHAWCEVFDEGRWKSVDIGFSFIPRRFPGGQDLPETREFAAACFGSRLNRLLPCTGPDADALLHDTLDSRPMAMFGPISATQWKAP